MIKEFSPAIVFLAKFVGIYLAGNLLYGIYITSYEPQPDPVTSLVTAQSSRILHMVGYETSARVHPTKPNILVLLNDRSIISVYEGCNGLNVLIVFTAFLVAFGPFSIHALLFWAGGLLIIHLANLLRVTALFYVALKYPSGLYFLHKYFFTAFLYLVVFVLWFVWIRKSRPSIRTHS